MINDTSIYGLLDEAEKKAFDSLGRYKFSMFGYWAAIWVHLNRVGGLKRPNPFKEIVLLARGGQSLDKKDRPAPIVTAQI